MRTRRGKAPRQPAAREAGAPGMLAGDVAKALGVGVQTLHYYERESLIPAPARTPAGYRLYTPELVERVSFIKRAQALGLALEEIKEVLALADRGACPCGHVQAALGAQLAVVDRRLQELRRFRDDLAALIARAGELATGSGGANICAIVEEATAQGAGDLTVTPLIRRGSRRSAR